MKTIPQRAVGWLLAIATVVIVMINQRDVGIARDETVYFSAGARYADWWIGLVTFRHGIAEAPIAATFGGAYGGGGNPEHPPLMKTLSGLSERVLDKDLGVLGEVSAFRLPAAIFAGVLVLLVYVMVLEIWGWAAAIMAALCVLLLPRALFHEGLACFDGPITTLWFATVYAYWRALADPRWRVAWKVGVLFGLALATKHTALLLPFALVAHYAHVVWRLPRAQTPTSLRLWQVVIVHRWRMVVAVVVLAPLTLFVLWPWLWFAPIAHVRGWLAFHMNHVHYNFEYLGHNWNAPRFPWHVPLVTTLFTVPVATLAAAAIGAGVWIRDAWRADRADRMRAPALLLCLSAGVAIGPFFLGSTPIFGAEKHWEPAIPTVCVAAGVGAVWAARQLAAAIGALIGPRLPAWRPLPARALQLASLAIVGGAIVLAATVETVTAEPYALTWYNALAGGAPGGADLGMNRQFWGVAARGVLPFLATQAPPAGAPARPVYTHDASPAWGVYQREGLVPASLPDAGWEQGGIDHSQLAFVVHELHFNRHDYMIWSAYGTVQPVFVLRSDGVPIVSVYRRPKLAP